MQRVLIVGDGPTGLSAALLLAKTGFDVTVVGNNETPVHKAHLHNVLGIDDAAGPHYVSAAREQAERFGARLVQADVERVEATGDAFRARTSEGTFDGEFLVLATGFSGLVEGLDLERGEDGVRIDLHGRTSRDKVYAGGSLARGMRSQVATSIGDGAAIAIDILSRVKGKPSHDYDVLKPAPKRTQTA